jgi:prepilin signal peptidase PulO-like enzyme (type II secretory pathway)
MLISGLAGLAFATLWRASGKGRLFPFGPALCIGLIATLLLSQHGYVPLADYYRFD